MVSVMLDRCPWLPFQPSSSTIFQEAHLCPPAECSSREWGGGTAGRGLVLAIFSLFALKLYFCAGFSFNLCTYQLPKTTCSPSQGCLTESFSSFKQVSVSGTSSSRKPSLMPSEKANGPSLIFPIFSHFLDSYEDRL